MIGKNRSERGFALAVSLMVITVLLVLGSVFIFRTVSEKNFSDYARLLTQAFYISEGGSQDALHELNFLINTDMRNTINGINPQTVAQKAQQYTDAQDGLGFLKWGQAQFVLDDPNNPQEALYSGQSINFGNGVYQYDIIVTEKSDPQIITTETWEFPYFYRIQSNGTIGGMSRKIVLTGDFTISVQRDNFAKYALFTDHHQTEGGQNVWFTDRTNFAGPLHTNERYNFALNPSGTFESLVTQHLTKARFYNEGSPFLDDADSNPPYDVPTFHVGYNRGVDEIVLASSVQKQDLIDQARGGDNTPGNGIFVANDGANLTGGIFVRGDATISMGVDAQENAVYSITEGSTTKIITVDIDANQTAVETVGIGTDTYGGLPDGLDNIGTIVYVDGAILSLGGTVQKDTELLVSSENDIVITDNIMYEDFTDAVGNPGDAGYVPPHAEGTENLFGIVCWGGDVRIGITAPDDINIHGTLMARSGVFTVDDYDEMGEPPDYLPRGIATLLGGAITQFYGAFGLFDGQTGQQLSGYGRNFVYDSRMATGESPPYYPSMRTFVVFTNDLTDKIIWQEGGF